MSLILCIETSVKTCSVALSLNGTTILCNEIHSDGFVHAEKLTLLIQELFENTDYLLSNLEAICISSGPGSFTGLRIGVAVAKGLCYGLNIPLIQLNSLEVLLYSFLASNPSSQADIFKPMIDARRMEVYCASYTKNGDVIKHPSAMVINEESFLDEPQNVVLFGDGADKLEPVNFKNQSIQISKDVKPSAASMSLSAFKKFTEKAFEDIAYFEPFYLKEFGETTA